MLVEIVPKLPPITPATSIKTAEAPHLPSSDLSAQFLICEFEIITYGLFVGCVLIKGLAELVYDHRCPTVLVLLGAILYAAQVVVELG